MRRMITVLALLTALLTASSAVFALPDSPREFTPVQDGFQPTGQSVLPYAPDRILVQFTAKAMDQANLDLPLEKGARAATATTGLASVDAILKEFGVTAIERTFGPLANKASAEALGVNRSFTLRVPEGTDIPAAARRLAADPNLAYAEPDLRAFPAVAPNDPQYPDNWGHNNTAQLPAYGWGTTWDHTGAGVGTVGFDTNAELAWNAPTGYGSSSAIVAILDSGVDTAHPDLNLMAGYDFGDSDNDPMDDSGQPGHGTACAGVAAAVADNNLGVAGIAGGVTIMPLKVADSGGSMYFSYIANALYYAADNGADVASMSFGAATSSSSTMDPALQYAYNNGVTLLAATGNENDSTISYPAINQYVIGVGAASPCGDRKRSSSNTNDLNPGVNADPNSYTCDGERWWGSNYGSTLQDNAGAVDIIAPTILPTTDISGSGGYQSGDYEPFFNGTSCATPYAAGVAALVKSANPSWSPSQVRDQLTSTAIDIVNVESVAGWDRYSGYGMVDAEAAVGGGPTAPVADFTADVTDGCAPQEVNFTDLSTGTVSSWSWDFGDGNTSTDQNPTNVYIFAGTYTVSLTVTGPVGSDSVTMTDYITVGQTPTADFSGTPLTGQVPLTVTFTDLSTGDPDTWSWFFGDSTQDTQQNPVHTYTEAGDYTVILIAENSCGQNMATKTAYVHVTPPPAPVAAFSGTPTSGCAPLEVTFTDESTGDITDWAWDFGDGNTDTAQNPVHTYAAPGTYDVALTVTGPGGSDTLTLTSYISVNGPPTAAFSASDSTGTAPFSVDFTDLSTGTVTSWLWDFGDSATDTVQNPTHQYTTAGTYTVTLTVGNDCGDDTMTATDMITVEPPLAPVADFSADPVSGCAPLEVAFTDLSTGDITGWTWDFGDGNTDTAQNPVHTYAAPGTYDVALTVTGPGGSDTKTSAGMIVVTGPPTAAFAMSDTTGTVPLTVTFTDLSTGDPTFWNWDFGDSSGSTDQNPVHTYATADTFTVVLIAGNACGADTTSLEVRVDPVSGPVAAFSADPTSGCAPLAVSFTDESTGDITAWNWDFGDASSDTLQNPVHTYTAAGSFDVRLIVFGPGGADTLTVAAMVHVDSLVTADFQADAVEGANPFTVTFTDQSTGGPTQWVWDFGDGATDTLQSPVHTYTAEGLYTVTMTATGPCGSDTIIKTDLITVHTAAGVGDVVNARFNLGRNYPNPFNPTTTIVFSLAKQSHARLEVFDATGKRLSTLVDEQMSAGDHRVTWQPFNLASGVYFARLTAEGKTAVTRMVLVR